METKYLNREEEKGGKREEGKSERGREGLRDQERVRKRSRPV